MHGCRNVPLGREGIGSWSVPRLGPWSPLDRGSCRRLPSSEASESWRRAGWHGAVRGEWWREVSPVGRRGALRGGSGQADGRSSGRAGRRRSLHHGVPGAPWRRRRVLPRRGKCRARAPQPRCSLGERASRTLGRRRYRRDPSLRCSPRVRLAPEVHLWPHCILLSPSS